MTGRDLQKAIIETARRHQWLVAHFYPRPVAEREGQRPRFVTPAAADGKGFPDLVMLRDRVLIVEVKGDKDRLRPEQIVWLSAWRIAGAEVHVWTPKDWREGVIEERLSSRRAEAA